MRHLIVSLAALGALLAAGCSSDSPDPGSGPDLVGAPRCPGVTDPGTDDPSPAGPYDSPAAFDRAACGESVAPMSAIDACGIWHLDLDFDEYGSGFAAVRVDLETPEGDPEPDLGGLLLGAPVSDVRLTEDDLFMRWAVTLDDGTEIVRAIDACGVRQDGSIAGAYASCFGDECFSGTFEAHKVEPLDEPQARGVTLVSEWSGPADAPWPEESMTLNVRQHEGMAYLARHIDGLRIVDLSDPAAPAERGHSPVMYPDFGEFYNDVKVVTAGESIYALMGSDVRGVVVIDVTDPDAPAEVDTFPDPVLDENVFNVHTLFVEGDRLYFTLGRGIEIYDVSDPAAVQRLGGYALPDEAGGGAFVHDLYVEDQVVYLNYWYYGMVVVDASDPAAPAQIGVFDDYSRRTSHSTWVTEAGGRRVAVHGDEDFGAHVRIVDVDPASEEAFQEIGSYQTRPAVSVHNIMAVGERALVTYYQDGLRVLDLSDPTAPAEVGHYNTWPGPEPGYGASAYEGAIGVDHDAARDLVLLADTHRGLLVLRLD